MANSIKRVCVDAIANELMARIPGLAGKISGVPAGPETMAPCLAAKILSADDFRFEPTQADEIYFDEDTDDGKLVVDVGQFTGMFSIQLFTTSAAERELYEQLIMDVFLSTEWAPGTLFVDTPNLIINSYASLYSAEIKVRLEGESWSDELAFESRRFSFIDIYVDYPALTTYDAVTLTSLQLALAGVNDLIVSTDDIDPSYHVEVQEDGSTKPSIPPRLILGIAGQSNAVGFADIDNVTGDAFDAPYEPVRLKQQDGTNANPPVWTFYLTEALKPRTNSATLNMGMELSLGRYVDARLSRFDIAKIGIGSTGLNDHWMKTALYPTVPPRLFDQMMTFMDDAERELAGELSVFIWSQGEFDATSSSDAAAYQANLIQFIADIRQIYPNIPFVFNKLHINNPSAFKNDVRAAQVFVAANVPNVFLIEVDDLALQGDNLHFTADSYITLGNRVGKACLAALNINTLLASFSTSVNGRTVTITDTSTDEDGSIVAWSYNWGDNTAPSTTQHPQHTYAADGTFTITQTITDNVGGTDTFSAQVTVAQPQWTIDATSSKGLPQNATEWAAIVSAFGLRSGLASPGALYLFQQSSGSVIDVIAGKNLTAAGNPTYQKAITGWSAKAIGANGTAVAQTLNNTTMPNINARSVLSFGYMRVNQSTAARQQVFHGVASGNAIEGVANSPVMRLRNGAAQNGVLNHVNIPRPFALKLDRTNQINALYSDIEKLSVAFNGASSGAELRFTLGITGDAAASVDVLYWVEWYDTAAEASDAEIKALNQALGWVVSGY